MSLQTVTETQQSRPPAYLSLRVRDACEPEMIKEVEREALGSEETVEEVDREQIHVKSSAEQREPVVIVTPPKRTRLTPRESNPVVDEQATTEAFPPSPHLHARDMIRVPSSVCKEDEKVRQAKQRIQRSTTLQRFSLPRLVIGGTTITLLSGTLLYYFFARRNR